MNVNVTSSNGTRSSSSDPFYQGTTFIASVTAAGGAGVATVASVSYYVLKSSQNFVRVPFAADHLAMTI